VTNPQTAVFFLGPDPVPALGSGLPVICADGCAIGGRVPGLAEFPAATRSSAGLLQQASVRDLLRRHATGLTVWKSSAVVERLAAELGLRLANSPAHNSRRLENKAFFSRAAAAAGLPVPAAVSGPATAGLEKGALALGMPLVFQLAHGFSGAQTYPVATVDELAELVERFKGHACRVAEMVEGTPVTVTGIAFPELVVTGPACLQLTGIPELTPHPMGSCGNDFSSPVPHQRAVDGTAAQVGEWLRQEGHRGIFGVDLVVSEDGRCWCIEVNPRLVASVPLWTLSARDQGRSSMLGQHLSCFGIGEQSPSPLSCHWSQLILYQLGESSLPGGAATARGKLDQEGSFSPTGGLTLDGPAEGEVAQLIRGGSSRGHELARLILEGPLTSPGGRLLPHLEAWVQATRAALEPAL
jgi:hypothetical protein